MRNIYKCLLVIFFIFLCSLVSCYTNKKILLKPISKTKVYSNFSDRLFPFAFSKEIFFIDNETSLLLIEEYEFDNGLFKDILKVKITGGHYKGKVVYILEEKVKVDESAIKKGVFAFFKDDTVVNNKLIKKDTQCKIEQSSVTHGIEVLTLKVIFNNKNHIYIEYSEKEKLHYIINKSSEILFHIRRGDKVIKVVNPSSLLPVKGAAADNRRSDEYGILYVDKNTKKIILKKHGYTSYYIDFSNVDEKVYIAFLEPLEYIKYYDDRTSIYKRENLEFVISSKNKSVDNVVGIKILSRESLSIFNFPEYTLEGYKIIDGFFINGVLKNTDINCNLKLQTDDVMIIHFDNFYGKWKEIKYDSSDKNIISLKIKNGHYLVLIPNESKVENISIQNNFESDISGILIRNRTGDYYSKSFINYNEKKSLMLTEDKYEMLFFSINKPDEIVQREFKVEKKNYNIDIYNYVYDDKILSKLDRKFESDNIILSHLYYGVWKREKATVNKQDVKKQDVLELLGDINIDIHNRISIKTPFFDGEGYLDILDDKRMLIYITSINNDVRSSIDNTLLSVDSSLFNSKLIIPVYYSFYLNILELSYDKIFFKRKRLKLENKNEKEIIMESIPYGLIEFPKSDSQTKYKLFLTKSP